MSIDRSEVEYVGFWPRLGAFVIDRVLFMCVITPVVLACYGWAYYETAAKPIDPSDPNALQLQMEQLKGSIGPKGPVDFLLQYVAPAVAVVMFWIYLKATPGKMAIQAEVVDAKTLGPMSPGQSILRYLCYNVSWLTCGLGMIWVGIDRKKQGFHDKLAGTCVIRKPRPPEPDELKEA